MRRLVAAATGLLATIGVGVVVGYLLIFAASPDRAARAVPASAAVYLNIYLQPSAGQKMNLFGLIGRVPGFRDPATLEQKIHDITQRVLGDLGLDYTADVRPWLGNQVAVAISPGDAASGGPHLLLLASVRDPVAARAAAPDVIGGEATTFGPEPYRGIDTMIGETVSFAVLDDLLVVADTRRGLRAALDADADVAPSLADARAFAEAMRKLPADHLASIYVDLRRVVSLDGDAPVGGYATAALALVAEPDGVHLDGDVPFDEAEAGADAGEAFALGADPAQLPGWMPADTRAEVSVFGLAQSILDLEGQLTADAAFAPAAEALNQLRALAAVGLGINLDRDLLPLFDGEAAIAVQGLEASGPTGQLLLRPSDPVDLESRLTRMRNELAERGSSVDTRVVRGVPITTIEIPEVASLAYGIVDGVVVIGLDAGAVAAAVAARLDDATLAAVERYTAPFALIGTHAGNELWVNLSGLLDASPDFIDPGSDFRDILHQIGELAAAAAASGDHLKVRSVLTVK
ncbi:MAG: DUF3352 domain-containing protein [Chloroflexota bacterium]